MTTYKSYISKLAETVLLYMLFMAVLEENCNWFMSKIVYFSSLKLSFFGQDCVLQSSTETVSYGRALNDTFTTLQTITVDKDISTQYTLGWQL